MTFVTLEDETGTINVVVWRATAEKYRRELLGATLLTVTGHVERVEAAAVPVVHRIASRLSDQSQLLGTLNLATRFGRYRRTIANSSTVMHASRINKRKVPFARSQ